MPLPVRYIDSHEYQEDGTASKSHHSNGSSQVTVSFPILDKATPSGKLQALSVHNLTNVIRELGSLAKHAESVMGDLADILVSYHQRTVHLEERTKHLSEEILPSLDADREGSGLNYIYMLSIVFGLSCPNCIVVMIVNVWVESRLSKSNYKLQVCVSYCMVNRLQLRNSITIIG